MLRLKAQTAAEWICHAFFAHETAIKEVASIELHAWLVGMDSHFDARFVGIAPKAQKHETN
jgi:hypothetical protein